MYKRLSFFTKYFSSFISELPFHIIKEKMYIFVYYIFIYEIYIVGTEHDIFTYIYRMQSWLIMLSFIFLPYKGVSFSYNFQIGLD